MPYMNDEKGNSVAAWGQDRTVIVDLELSLLVCWHVCIGELLGSKIDCL